jgi:hypothetical protein
LCFFFLILKIILFNFLVGFSSKLGKCTCDACDGTVCLGAGSVY